MGHDKANSSNPGADALGWVSKFAEGNDGCLGRQESMRRHSGRMAITKADFEKMWASLSMGPRYPKFISEKLITVWPLWCLRVEDERPEDAS